MRKKKYGERFDSRHDLYVTDNVTRTSISNPPNSHGMIVLGNIPIKIVLSPLPKTLSA
jgi:hypothetical protein